MKTKIITKVKRAFCESVFISNVFSSSLKLGDITLAVSGATSE